MEVSKLLLGTADNYKGTRIQSVMQNRSVPETCHGRFIETQNSASLSFTLSPQLSFQIDHAPVLIHSLSHLLIFYGTIPSDYLYP